MLKVLVPSRGRPQNIARLVGNWNAEEARLIVYVDLDDPEVEAYEALEGDDWELHIGPRLRLGGTLNAHAPTVAATCEAVGFMGDDHVPRTRNWDQRILEVIRNEPMSVVYGNDLVRGRDLATAAFMDSRIVTTLGYMVIPGSIHLFFDDTWMLWGRRLGTLTYLDDVVIEHVHPIAGKTEWDAGYVEVNAGPIWDHDEAKFKEYQREQLADDLRKLHDV